MDLKPNAVTLRAAAPLLALFAGAWACGRWTAPTSVKEILASPRTYDGKVVTVKGSAHDPTSIPLLRFFKLRDDSGEIFVVTERAVPAEGENVEVTGRVHQAYALAGRTLIVIKEDAER